MRSPGGRGLDHVFEAGEGSVGDHLSLLAASKSGLSGGGTEDDPVGPVIPSAAPTMGGGGTIARKATRFDFSRTISLDAAEIDDEEWIDPTPIPATSLETAPRVFPPPIAKTKSSSSAKSRKLKEACA